MSVQQFVVSTICESIIQDTREEAESYLRGYVRAIHELVNLPIEAKILLASNVKVKEEFV